MEICAFLWHREWASTWAHLKFLLRCGICLSLLAKASPTVMLSITGVGGSLLPWQEAKGRNAWSAYRIRGRNSPEQALSPRLMDSCLIEQEKGGTSLIAYEKQKNLAVVIHITPWLATIIAHVQYPKPYIRCVGDAQKTEKWTPSNCKECNGKEMRAMREFEGRGVA